tara:strand:+ start:20 stop:877 length:858 start_codon:yes stop_codon:yes gene_type:complete
MAFTNYKKLFDNQEKIIDNKNLLKFIFNIDKDLRIIGITFQGRIFQIDWQTCINNDQKLDSKFIGNIDPNEIINFHTIEKGKHNYLCTLNSDGRFKKVFFDDDMIKSNRSFSITKLKNNVKILDSFIFKEEELLIILTSLGRIFKFYLSNKYIVPTTKQSQGLVLTKLLPKEKIVSCCTSTSKEKLYLISQKGKIFGINNSEVYFSDDAKLGFLNEKTQLKNDTFIKIIPENLFIDIETNKNKSARLNIDIFNHQSNKSIFLKDFLNLDKDEYLINCFCLDNFLD